MALPAEGWADGRPRGGGPVLGAWWSGPGLGRDPRHRGDEVRRLVAESPVPVVVDADGLFALGRLDGPTEPLRAPAPAGRC